MNIYPGGSSGIKGADILGAVSDNLVQHAMMWGSHVAGEEKIMELFDLPLFVPKDHEFRVKLWKALEPDFRAMLKDRYNVYLWRIGQESPRMIYTKKPVKTLADMKGMKIRAMGPVETAFTQAIGAQPVPVAWTETYTALQQGMVDGNWVADLPQFDAKLYEVTNYIVDIGNAGAGNMSITSIKALDSLPGDYRQKLLSHQDEYFKCNADGSYAGTSKGRELLTTKGGMKVAAISAKDRAFMIAQAKPIVDAWQKDLDAESRRIFEKAKAMIDEHNAKNM
jgi:TRAP-type C4-dicarboxylate transport system substrate-binding protein